MPISVNVGEQIDPFARDELARRGLAVDPLR
jgi:hypothetical protein